MHRAVAVLVLVAVVVAACGTPVASPVPRGAERSPLSRPTAPAVQEAPVGTPLPKERTVTVKTLKQGHQWPSPEGPLFALVTGPRAWETFLARHRAAAEAWPAVDWDQVVVFVALMGQKRTGGYSITVDRVTVRDGTLLVQVRETAPAPGEMTIQVLTAPYHVVAVPRRALPAAPFTVRVLAAQGVWEIQVPTVEADALYLARPTGPGLERPTSLPDK